MSYTYENGGFMNGDSSVVSKRCQCHHDEYVIVPKQWLQQDQAGYSLWNSERDIELSNLEWEWVGLCRPDPEIVSF